MIKKIFAIALALLLVVSLIACNNEEETTEDNTIDIEQETTGTESETETDETGAELGTGSVEIGDPGEYTYTECDQTVYVNNPNSAVTLRSATYEACGSVAHGTELKRIGLSTDSANYWSKVSYNDKEYYVATKFLTTIKDADEGFVDVEKTVVVNKQTGSLNIRNLPTFEGSAIIGYAIAGVQIKVIAENTQTGWYKIEFVPYGSTETAIGYIKSGKENFETEKTETEANTESDTESGATEGSTEGNTEASTGK